MGLKLRGDDPAGMKDFVVGVHERAAELGQKGERCRGNEGDFLLANEQDWAEG